ncbi:unnamed protein product [Prunus armeniaca]|uniref:Zinc finger, CCHC-type n=1 Tax=Prunus armeniaca TaxID=36596 RepID=A0A6J5V720_PRUAR|nr:unnamed protein product [Prunus armeniaca]
MLSMKDFTTNFMKLERFDGGNFRRWQKKLHFLLTSLKVVHVLTTPRPTDGHICNAMFDTLFDIYHEMKTSNEISNALETKHMTEDATNKKFLVSKFQMVDDRIYAIMEKLHPSWKEYKKILKHKKEDMSINQLGKHIRIEEKCWVREKVGDTPNSSKVYMVEDGPKQSFNNHGSKKRK